MINTAGAYTGIDMRRLGTLLWIGGLALIVYAVGFFDTSLSSYGSDRIVNLDLQQRQLLMVMVGGLAFLAGVGLHVASYFLPESRASEMPQRAGLQRRRPLRPVDEDESLSIPAGMLVPAIPISDADMAQQEADSRAFLLAQSKRQ